MLQPVSARTTRPMYILPVKIEMKNFTVVLDGYPYCLKVKWTQLVALSSILKQFA